MRLCEGAESPETVIADSYEPPCGCWEMNTGPLEEQPVLLTTEPSLQPPWTSFIICLIVNAGLAIQVVQNDVRYTRKMLNKYFFSVIGSYVSQTGFELTS